MREIWKDIKGYEGLYQVSDLGRVRSLDSIRMDSIGREKLYKGQVLKQTTQKGRKRKVVYLSENGKQTARTVHTLVMQAFVGAPPADMEVCHNDGDEGNNVLTNLRYDTKRNNQIDIYRYGSTPSAGKLTPEQVLEIRELLASGECYQKEIAQMYEVAQQTISEINTGKAFSWLDDKNKWREIS
ncbi:NUMOD4 domain-containing protein [Staphylococcus saprophyticus]|nr:NUMOD4 domain-containing protein [Staphylococcus saprophyticus]